MDIQMTFADLIRKQQALIDVLKEYIITHLTESPERAVEILRKLEERAAERAK